ncbi:MAG: right-handed parallel beta-helix repeat-containing protein [Thermoplasmata archaeon]|nr:MAG: right-handed parallel beta-helix repeat-containing protein [Thermoplasmata archaeon]
MKKIIHLVVILLLIGSIFAGVFIIISSPQVSAYTAHEPIKIVGDADFSAQAAAEGWPGNGTAGNPYIIEGYEIDAEYVNGIDITSTSVHFIIRDSLLMGNAYRAISLINVMNATIYNCTIKYWNYGFYLESSSGNNITENKVLNISFYSINLWNSDDNIIVRNYVSNSRYGINLDSSHENNIINNSIFLNQYDGLYIQNSRNNKISDNTIINNGGGIINLYSSGDNNLTGNIISDNGRYGIYLSFSERITIKNNNISNNEKGLYFDRSDYANIQGNIISSNDYGIELIFSRGINISANTMIGCGIGISGDTINYWYPYEIDSTNTLNGKIIYYWKDRVGGTIPPDAGQVILVNCTNVKVENQELTHGTIGILLGYSFNIHVTGNNISSNSEYGIYFHRSERNDIVGNTISDNGCGIFLKSSIGNIFHHNNIVSNDEQLNCSYHLENVWDNRNGKGNYWSDYNGTDVNNDGVGDTDLPHWGVEFHPLMNPTDIQENGYPPFPSLLFIIFIFSILILISLILILPLRKKKKSSIKSPEAENQDTDKNQPKF